MFSFFIGDRISSIFGMILFTFKDAMVRPFLRLEGQITGPRTAFLSTLLEFLTGSKFEFELVFKTKLGSRPSLPLHE